MPSSSILFLSLILISLANACFVVRTNAPTVSSECLCPPVFMYGQQDVERNAGGRYLKNRETWRADVRLPDPEYPCWLEVGCPYVAGVSSFYTIMLRDQGNPIFINRVVNNQSTFVPGYRSIGNFECRLATDGTYQWHFHDYPLKNLGFTCQADMDNCNCEQLNVDTSSGVEVKERYPDAPHQCSLFEASCPPTLDQHALLYSKSAIIASAAASPSDIYDELMCIKEDNGGFNWYFSNLRLEGNVSIGCDTFQDAFGEPGVCTCGVFPKITTKAQLEKYDTANMYDGAIIGNNAWEPGCGFRMSCDDGFTGVVFSDNYKPLMPGDSNIACTYNPVTNQLRIWIVNSVRVINPAATCLKLN